MYAIVMCYIWYQLTLAASTSHTAYETKRTSGVLAWHGMYSNSDRKSNILAFYHKWTRRAVQVIRSLGRLGEMQMNKLEWKLSREFIKMICKWIFNFWFKKNAFCRENEKPGYKKLDVAEGERKKWPKKTKKKQHRNKRRNIEWIIPRN